MRPGDRGWVRHPEDGTVVEVVFIRWCADGLLACRVIGRDRETVYLLPSETLAATAGEVAHG